jgi:hypothetical protein
VSAVEGDAKGGQQEAGETVFVLEIFRLFHHLGDGIGIVLLQKFCLGLDVHVFEIVGGGLESVEEQASFFVGDGVGENGLDDLHQGELDGVGVLEQGQGDGETFAGITASGAMLAAELRVEMAERFAVQRGRAKAQAVKFRVTTLRDIRW